MSATNIHKYILPIASALRPQNRMERANRLTFAFHTAQSIASSAIICFAYAQILVSMAVQSYPFILIFAAVISAFVNRLYAYLERRIRTHALITGTVLFLSLVTYITSQYFDSMNPVIRGFVLILLSRLWVMLDDTAFWSISEKAIDPSKESSLFNVNKNYKLFSKTIGFTLTLFLLPALQKDANFLRWTYVWGCISAVFVWLLLRDSLLKRRLWKYHKIVTKYSKKKSPESFLNQMLKNGYAMKLALMGVFIAMLISFLEFIFLKISENTVTTHESLVFIASLFSGSYMIVTILYLVIGSKKMFVLGIRKLLVTIPLAFLVFTFFNLVYLYFTKNITYWPMAVMVFFFIFYRGIIFSPSASSLLHPFHKRYRSFIFTNIRGLFFTIGTALSGFVLILADAHIQLASPLELIGILFIILVAWWGITLLVSKDYKHILQGAVELRNVESYELAAQDRDFKHFYTEKINSDKDSEVIYALDALSGLKIPNIEQVFKQTLQHPSQEVKYFTLKRIRELNLQSLSQHILPLMQDMDNAEQVKIESVRTMSVIDPMALTEIVSYLDHHDVALRKGALISLLEHQSPDARTIAKNRLKTSFHHTHYTEKMLAIEVVSILGLEEYHDEIKELMLSNHMEIRKLAINCAGKVKHSSLIEPLIIAIKSGELVEESSIALSKYGNLALNRIEQELAFNYRKHHEYLLEFCKVLGMLKSQHAYQILWKMVDYPWKKMQISAFKSLQSNEFVPQNKADFYLIEDHLNLLFKHFYWLNHAIKVLSEQQKYQLLINSLYDEIALIENHIDILFNLLVKFTQYHSKEEIREILGTYQSYDDIDLEEEEEEDDWEDRGLEEDVWNILPLQTAERLMTMKGYYTLEEKAELLSNHYPKPMTDDIGVLINLLQPSRPQRGIYTDWTKAITLNSIKEINSPTMLQSVARFLSIDNFLLLEPALFLIQRYAHERGQDVSSLLEEMVSPIRKDLLMSILNEETKPLMDIEKVIMIKATRLFSDLPEHVLADVASILKEERVKKGSTIFQQGDISNNMYIVYNGEIKIHEGTFTYDTMIDGDYFGDLGFLDSSPRLMNATAMRDSVLLKLDQSDFYTLMSYRTDITRGIMQVLGQRIREQSRQLNAYRKNG